MAMKRVDLILFFLILSVSAWSADINLDDVRQIEQKLENIDRESLDLPKSKRVRIQFELESIRQILEGEKVKAADRMADKIEKNATPIKGFSAKSPYMPVYRLYNDVQLKNLSIRIKAAKPFKNQLTLIKDVDKHASFTINQIKELLNDVRMLADKKETALVLLPNAVDLENVDQLYFLFTTPSEKAKIDRIAEDHLQ